MNSQSINRRTWLTNSITGAAALRSGLSTACAKDVSEILDIIDCHTHFYDPTRTQGVPWPNKQSFLYRTVLPQHLQDVKQYQPVTGTVVVECSAWLEDNAWLLELAKDEPFIVGIVGHLIPGTKDFTQHVKRFAANPLYRGIRIQASLLKQLLAKNDLNGLKLLAKHELSLDVNGGPDSPEVVAAAAAIMPTLRFIQNHVANIHITKDVPPKRWQDGMRAAAKYPNVFSKLSGLVEGAGRGGQTPPTDMEFYKPYIDVVWNAFGDDRMIYGSNWPVCDVAADYFTLQKIAMEYASTKGDNAVRKFCSLNAKAAYKWVERRGRRAE